MGKRSGRTNQTKFVDWIESYESVSSWLAQYDLEQLLHDNDGLVKLENFLPSSVADGILHVLETVPAQAWNLTAAGDDYAHNNIQHNFLSVKQHPQLDSIFRIFTLLLPDSLFTFSAAKYCKQGHIVPHDDRAYTNVMMDDGSIQLCSRTIACIYYLTKHWKQEDGGALVDHGAAGGPQVYVPTYNSFVAFTIPRWHEVTPVSTDRPRYSIFGWFLEPGKLYKLNTGPAPLPHTDHKQHQVDGPPQLPRSTTDQKSQHAERKDALPTGHKSRPKKRLKSSFAEPDNEKGQQRRQQQQQQQQGVKEAQQLLSSAKQQAKRQQSMKPQQASSHAAGPRQQSLQPNREHTSGMAPSLTLANNQQQKHVKHKQAKLQLEGHLSKTKKMKRTAVEHSEQQ